MQILRDSHSKYRKYLCIQTLLTDGLRDRQDKNNMSLPKGGRHYKLEAQWAEPVSLTFHSALRKLNTEPSIDASHQILIHLAMQFQRRRFLEIDQSETRIACLVIDQNKMSNLYRGPSIDASYQVSYHLAKQFQRKSCFRNRPIRNKNCLWRPCLLTNQNGMSNSYRGPSIDASYRVSVHLVKLFQSRRFLEID